MEAESITLREDNLSTGPSELLTFLQERCHRDGYPDTKFEPFKVIDEIDNFNERLKLTEDLDSCKGSVDRNYAAFSVGEVFFQNVAKAIKALNGRLTVEVVRGDVSNTVVKMRAGATQSRPEEFPTRFARIWLSNVP